MRPQGLLKRLPALLSGAPGLRALQLVLPIPYDVTGMYGFDPAPLLAPLWRALEALPNLASLALGYVFLADQRPADAGDNIAGLLDAAQVGPAASCTTMGHFPCHAPALLLIAHVARQPQAQHTPFSLLDPLEASRANAAAISRTGGRCVPLDVDLQASHAGGMRGLGACRCRAPRRHHQTLGSFCVVPILHYMRIHRERTPWARAGLVNSGAASQAHLPSVTDLCVHAGDDFLDVQQPLLSQVHRHVLTGACSCHSIRTCQTMLAEFGLVASLPQAYMPAPSPSCAATASDILVSSCTMQPEQRAALYSVICSSICVPGVVKEKVAFFLKAACCVPRYAPSALPALY